MIRRFFTRLLLLVLIGVCGYNWLQMQRLESQVAILQSQQRAYREAAPILDKTRTPEARLSLPFLHIHHLQAQWKHLRNQANAFRSTSKKVFHEII